PWPRCRRESCSPGCRRRPSPSPSASASAPPCSKEGPSMRCDSLYLSPHLDDAVLSCAARILEETTAGRRVVVATLCPGAAAGREELSRRRREEAARAVASLGASALHLGLPDAPFRRPYYSSFRAIVLGCLPTDGEDVAAARDAVTSA